MCSDVRGFYYASYGSKYIFSVGVNNNKKQAALKKTLRTKNFTEYTEPSFYKSQNYSPYLC